MDTKPATTEEDDMRALEARIAESFRLPGHEGGEAEGRWSRGYNVMYAPGDVNEWWDDEEYDEEDDEEEEGGDEWYAQDGDAAACDTNSALGSVPADVDVHAIERGIARTGRIGTLRLHRALHNVHYCMH